MYPSGDEISKAMAPLNKILRGSYRQHIFVWNKHDGIVVCANPGFTKLRTYHLRRFGWSRRFLNRAVRDHGSVCHVSMLIPNY